MDLIQVNRMYDEQTRYNKSDAATHNDPHVTNKTPALPQVLTVKNNFAPTVKSKTLTLSEIVRCLQYGFTKYEKLPKVVQNALDHVPDPLGLKVDCKHCEIEKTGERGAVQHDSGVFIMLPPLAGTSSEYRLRKIR